jgi:hypothetical protein
VLSLGQGAFGGCAKLTSVTLPNSITKIGSGTFSNCQRLSSIIIPESVTSIETGAFMVCLGLVSITIPKNVATMGDMVFASCTNLKEITCYAKDPPALGEMVFNNVNQLTCVLKVYDTSLASYSKASQWKDFLKKAAMFPTGLTALSTNNLRCYIANTEVHVVCDKLIKSVELVNMNGAVVGRIKPYTNEVVIPTTEKGMLLVRVQTTDQIIQTQKLIITK